MSLSFSWQWLSSIHESAEIRETGAKLRIAIGSDALTRNVDEWSRTVSDDVRVSAYPLALWLASNWWRLRWEPLPTGLPTLSWRMSHEVAAAGYGYIWPKVLIASDGEAVRIWATPSPEGEPAPVNYLAAVHRVVTAEDFERSIDGFFEGVVARLNAVGIVGTQLQLLLAELAEERLDVPLAAYRRLEAIAGFDAGEGPDQVLAQLEALVPLAGMNAVEEMATLCASTQSERILADAVRMTEEAGLRAEPIAIAGETARTGIDRSAPAWVRGKDLASSLRRRLSMDGQPISDSILHRLMGIESDRVANEAGRSCAPVGLAVRQPQGHLALHLRKRRPTSIRFELARFLCDDAMAVPSDRWLPVTDAKTSRQKVQRAFAAEFLCPIDGLTRYLGGDFSDEAIEDAAQHFQVGSLVVQTQLVNNHVLPRELLAEFQGDGAFLYRVDK